MVQTVRGDLTKIRFPSMDEVRKYAKPHSRLCNTSGGSSTAHAWGSKLLVSIDAGRTVPLTVWHVPGVRLAVLVW